MLEQLQHTANCEQHQQTDPFCNMLCSLCSVYYEPLCVLKYVEKTETLGKDPLTQCDAKGGKLLSAVKLCGCVSTGMWLALCALWIRYWDRADSDGKWFAIFGAESGSSSVLVNQAQSVMQSSHSRIDFCYLIELGPLELFGVEYWVFGLHMKGTLIINTKYTAFDWK